jgi:predicted site-specific integrase-resolvase
VTVYVWAKKGIIPCVRLQGAVRFDPAEVQKWIAEKHVITTQNFTSPAQVSNHLTPSQMAVKNADKL